MTKRMTALILALTLVFALGAPAMSADDDPAAAAETAETLGETADEAGTEETEAAAEEADAAEASAPASPDAKGTLSFANLGSRMLENDYSMRTVQESIDDIESHDYDWRSDNLKLRLNDIAGSQWWLVTKPVSSPLESISNSMASNAMQSTYNQLSAQLDAVRNGDAQQDDEAALRQYRNMQNLMIMGAEMRYIGLKTIEANDAALTRNLAALDRGLATMRVSRDNGLVSALSVQELENSRAQLVSGRQTLRMNWETNLLQLKALVGTDLGEPLALGALPKVTAEQLAAMDLEADLEKAMAGSYELFDAKRQIDDFRDGTYSDVLGALGSSDKIFEVSQVKHGLQALRYNYESAAQSFELKFRTLYAQVKDCAQILDAARSALALEEMNYAVSALKCEQGTISRNALADAADTLASAKDTVSGAERDLLTAYRSYYWAVEHGIVN